MKAKYAMSKSAALREASQHVGDIHRRSSTDYVFYAPYNRPGGPTTENQADNYWKARQYRTASVVSVALKLMEVPNFGMEYGDRFAYPPDWEIDRAQELGIGSARDILNYVLQQSKGDSA